MKPSTETSGLFFPKAIGQLFWIIYLELVMLAVLFFVSQAPETQKDGSIKTKQEAIPQGVFAVVLIVIVFIFQMFLRDMFKPLYESLPLTLVKDDAARAPASHLTPGSQEEKQALLSASSAVDRSATSEGEYTSANASEGAGGLDADAFENPAATTPQRPLWFPNDKFGLGSSETAAAHAKNLDATNEGTSYDNKNRIQVFAAEPPGEPLE